MEFFLKAGYLRHELRQGRNEMQLVAHVEQELCNEWKLETYVCEQLFKVQMLLRNLCKQHLNVCQQLCNERKLFAHVCEQLFNVQMLLRNLCKQLPNICEQLSNEQKLLANLAKQPAAE
jgi:hypothetical protein